MKHEQYIYSLFLLIIPFNKEFNIIVKKNYSIGLLYQWNIKINAGTTDCESTPNPEGQGEALPATDKETCIRGREGLVTHAVVAISARDMSVGAVIGDHPP